MNIWIVTHSDRHEFFGSMEEADHRFRELVDMHFSATLVKIDKATVVKIHTENFL